MRSRAYGMGCQKLHDDIYERFLLKKIYAKANLFSLNEFYIAALASACCCYLANHAVHGLALK